MGLIPDWLVPGMGAPGAAELLPAVLVGLSKQGYQQPA
jgi:hypothetical protein